jgi:N-methylhydantoinase A/oxoprolinase/acetone carboxylase beta subunit
MSWGGDKDVADVAENKFIALDLAGAVRGIALCEESPGVGLDSPGWLVRSRIVRMHSWIGSAGPSSDRDQTRAEILAAVRRWQVDPGRMRLVLVSIAGRAEALELADAAGCSSVCVPQAGHVISPRGIAPAGGVKDYSHSLCPPPARLDLRTIREAFVPMMERAADDVQADGLEQDDSFLDRYAEIRIRGELNTMVVPMETLTDQVWLVNTCREAYAAWWGRPLDPDAIEVLSLRLRCAVGSPDHGFRPGAGSHESPAIRATAGWQCETTRLGHVLCRAIS